jgi:hypothetical protein
MPAPLMNRMASAQITSVQPTIEAFEKAFRTGLPGAM